MIYLSHSGKQHAYQVAKALKNLGYLQKFYTSSYIKSKWLQNHLLNKEDTFWTRRFISDIYGKDVDANWRFELKEIFYRTIFGNNTFTQNAIYQRDINFDHYVAKKLQKLNSNTKHQSLGASEFIPQTTNKPIFWGFQGSCHNSLISANKRGLTTIIELATAHVTMARKLLKQEQKLHPEWADSIDNLQFPPHYFQRLLKEPHLADHVIAASDFTRQSLLQAGVSNERIKVLPLGFDARGIEFGNGESDFGNRPLKILYAGRITQRKGIKYLLEAMHYFGRNQVELHVVGFIHGSGKGLKPFQGLYHHHPPVSQTELFKLYKQFDVLALPTIFEGFGLVLVEAMAAGLPVITTPHSIGPELIKEDQNGYLVPIRDVQAIVNAIEKLITKTPEEYQAIRHSARQTALSFTWDAYQERLNTLLQEITS